MWDTHRHWVGHQCPTQCLHWVSITLGDEAFLLEPLHLPRTLSTQATDVLCGWQMPELSEVTSGPSMAPHLPL